MHTIKKICLDIEAGYNAEKCGLDDDMLPLLVDLGDHAAEIASMVTELEQRRATPTHDELWKAQLTYWPNSIELTFREVAEWANAAPTDERRTRRWRSVAMALQYPSHVFYRTKLVGGSMGCRVGLDGPDYLSNYDDL